MVFGVDDVDPRQRGLVKKIYLPREIFPLASVGCRRLHVPRPARWSCLGAAIVFQALPAPVEMLWFFPSVLLILIYGLALGLLLAALNVYLRDVQYLTDVVMMLAMWAVADRLLVDHGQSMRFAALGLPAWVLEVYTDNPITIGVLGFHKAFWGAGTDADYPADLGLRIADRRRHRPRPPLHLASRLHALAGQLRAGAVMIVAIGPTHGARPDIVRLDGVTKHFTRPQGQQPQGPHRPRSGAVGSAHRQDFTAVDGVDLAIDAGTTVGLLGRQRLGQEHPPQAHRRHRLADAADACRRAAGWRRSSSSAPDSTPTSAGARTSTSTRRSWGSAARRSTARFDEIVEFSGIGDFIDTAGEVLLVGHVRAARLRGRRPHRPRRPPRRRGARRRRRGVPAQVHGADRTVPQRGSDDRPGVALGRPGRRSCATAGSSSRTARSSSTAT